jgi:hypothetical protein
MESKQNIGEMMYVPTVTMAEVQSRFERGAAEPPDWQVKTLGSLRMAHLLSRVRQHADIGTTLPNFKDYPLHKRPIVWIASKIVLALSSFLTLGQRNYNNAVSQMLVDLSSLYDRQMVLEQELIRLRREQEKRSIRTGD